MREMNERDAIAEKSAPKAVIAEKGMFVPAEDFFSKGRPDFMF